MLCLWPFWNVLPSFWLLILFYEVLWLKKIFSKLFGCGPVFCHFEFLMTLSFQPCKGWGFCVTNGWRSLFLVQMLWSLPLMSIRCASFDRKLFIVFYNTVTKSPLSVPTFLGYAIKDNKIKENCHLHNTDKNIVNWRCFQFLF